MAKHKPNIKFPQTSIVERGRPEEGAFVPLVNALTRPKMDARHQAVSVQTTLGIYEETRDTQRGQKYRKYGGKPLATVTGFHYLKAEDGVGYLFLEKKEVQKVVKELKAKPNLPWPLWFVFAESKKDLPSNLNELEKSEPPVSLEEIPSGLLDFSNPRNFERCYFAQVRLFDEGRSDDEAMRKNIPELVKARNKFSKEREEAKRKAKNTVNTVASKLWEEKFYEAVFFLRKIDDILELAEVHLGVDLAEISKQINTGADSATDSITVSRAAEIASCNPKTIRRWAKKHPDFPAEWFDKDGNKESRIRYVRSEQELKLWLSKYEEFKKTY